MSAPDSNVQVLQSQLQSMWAIVLQDTIRNLYTFMPIHNSSHIHLSLCSLISLHSEIYKLNLIWCIILFFVNKCIFNSALSFWTEIRKPSWVSTRPNRVWGFRVLGEGSFLSKLGLAEAKESLWVQDCWAFPCWNHGGDSPDKSVLVYKCVCVCVFVSP